MRYAFVIFSLLLVAGCKEKAMTDPKFPVRYLICSGGMDSCIDAARFDDLESCETHKHWSGMLCENRADGSMLCLPDHNSVLKAYCTL